MKRGLTLIELLASIAVIAILASLLFLTVQNVRRSARVTICQSKVAEIVKASLSYETAMGRLPDRDWQAEIHEHLSLNIAPVVSSREAQATHFVPLICPDDKLIEEADLVRGSYLACAGNWIDGDGGFDGVIPPTRNSSTKISQVTDGLSNTSFVSESVFPIENSTNRLRQIWSSKREYANGELERFVAEVESMPTSPSESGWSGTTYPKSVHFKYSELRIGTFIGLGSNLYNHAVEPQSPTVLNHGSQLHAIAPASSTHTTVTVGFCDGHVKQYSQTVARDVWRSLGARNDGISQD